MLETGYGNLRLGRAGGALVEFLPSSPRQLSIQLPPAMEGIQSKLVIAEVANHLVTSK